MTYPPSHDDAGIPVLTDVLLTADAARALPAPEPDHDASARSAGAPAAEAPPQADAPDAAPQPVGALAPPTAEAPPPAWTEADLAPLRAAILADVDERFEPELRTRMQPHLDAAVAAALQQMLAGLRTELATLIDEALEKELIRQAAQRRPPAR